MKVVFLTSNSPQNFALSHLLKQNFNLISIVYENRFTPGNRLWNYLKKSRYNLFSVVKKLYHKYRLRNIDNDLTKALKEKFGTFDGFAECNTIEVKNINEPRTIDHLKNLDFDIIVVSGTYLLKKQLLSLKPGYGIINLHTGLSPYYNGGPSCTFWALFNEDIYHLGSTVMFIDSGIDTGNIILSEYVIAKEDDTYGSLESRVIELGNQLVIKAINLVMNNQTMKGIPQHEFGTGKVYYNRDFTYSKRLSLQRKLEKGMIKKLVKAYDENKQKEVRVVRYD